MTLGTKSEKSRFSEHISLRCDPETKKEILAFCESSGISLCQLYDGLTKAFLYGIKIKSDLGTQCPTINLTIERVVGRLRRETHEGVRDEVTVDKYIAEHIGNWIKVPISEGVNDRGHAVGCQCLECAPDLHKKKKRFF